MIKRSYAVEIEEFLPELGENLKSARKIAFPSDTLDDFSRRINVSRATLQKMEKGDLKVSMKHYYAAAGLLRLENQFTQLFYKSPSLFG